MDGGMALEVPQAMQQAKGILTAGHTKHDPVAVLNHSVFHQGATDRSQQGLWQFDFITHGNEV